MPKAKKPQFYAVRRGRQPGVYETWDEAKAQVHGFPGAAHQGFKTRAEAEAFLAGSGVTSGPQSTSVKPLPYDRPASSKPETNSAVAPLVSSEVPEPGKIGLEEVVDGKTWRVVYTDGACSSNGQTGARGGIGVYWGPGMQNVSERLPGAQTNNRAELIALIRALETDPDPTTPLMLKTDSRYSIQCIRDWLPKWRKNGFRTGSGTVKNKELLLYLSALMDERPGMLRLYHVRGHVGIPGNEAADRLAVAGAALSDVEDRDWTVKQPEPTKTIPDGVEFDIPPEALLSDDELQELERTQDF